MSPDHSLDLFLRHRKALIDYARPIVGDEARAEDVVQDAWLRYARFAEKQAFILNPSSLLYRIVRNLAIDAHRRQSREINGAGAERALETTAEISAGPETATVHKHELRQVMAALKELPERTQRAFHLHRFDNLTYSQIAAELGISQGLAHSLVASALVHCMKRLNQK
ncbi:sigma-70 family RNA polymerase sigma factor [Asticcacaulis sp. W401b]|uniref:sigma-70 family RNA polymerase sigma factor n=1 Tax=Asticcacaulis sp. W401b TaxID=3388666 RepID=UPI003970AFEA